MKFSIFDIFRLLTIGSTANSGETDRITADLIIKNASLAPRQIDFPYQWRKLAEQDRRFLFPRDKKGGCGENPW